MTDDLEDLRKKESILKAVLEAVVLVWVLVLVVTVRVFLVG